MRLWFRYLHEKRHTVILYLLTVFLFVSLGALYHLENLEKLMYAAFLTFVLWGAAGFLDGWKYVQQSRTLESIAWHFQQSGELNTKEIHIESLETEEGSIEGAESYEAAWWNLMALIYDKSELDRVKWEERAAERRDYYVMWTHQIKTPISALRLLLEKNQSNSRDDFLMREELFKIEQYAEMALTFQRLESISSDLVLQEYDLYAMLKNTVKKYAVLFINRGLTLELQETDARVITDEKWFCFCVEQILSNSIKYTPKGKIIIRTEKQERSGLGAEYGGRGAVLYIEDTGIGIRPEDLPRIFERGFTGYNGRLDKKSTGIGLYLCRKIFAHLGITVRVESEEEKGTKVIMMFPDSVKH